MCAPGYYGEIIGSNPLTCSRCPLNTWSEAGRNQLQSQCESESDDFKRTKFGIVFVDQPDKSPSLFVVGIHLYKQHFVSSVNHDKIQIGMVTRSISQLGTCTSPVLAIKHKFSQSLRENSIINFSTK